MRQCGVAALACVLGLAPIASAQTVSATTGAINGRVTDATGGVLPGATVTATSPAMQGQQVVVTDAGGNYRIPAVPPGEYRLVYELPGFATIVRDRIRIGLGFTATVNVELKVAQLEETVTVTGESPVVDVTSTKTTTNFDSTKLAALPGARDFWSILANSPAVTMQRIDVGGSRAGTQTPYSVYDTKATQHRPMVEGMVMTEGTGGALFYYDFGSMDEVAIGTATHSADMGWPGVQSQFIARSGGNQLRGTARFDYQDAQIQARNIDEAQIARGVRGGGGLEPEDLNRMHRYYDVNADVGGYVRKDRLWFYLSARDQDVRVRLANFPVIPHRTRLSNYSGKGTYSLNQNNKIIGYTMGGRKNQPNRLDRYRIGATSAFHTSTESTWNQLYWGFVHKVEWNSVVNDRSFFEVRAGKIGYDWPNFRYADSPAYEDLGTNEVFGANRDWQRDRQRAQLLGSYSYYKDGWAGNHNFKIGGEAFREIRRDHRGPGGRGMFPGDVLHILRNGAPIEVYLFETPSVNDSRLRTTSFYVNDTWSASRHLTLNLGVRFDRYREYYPDQEHGVGRFNPTPLTFPGVDTLLTWNLWAPRIGATYDLRGNGKTVLKVNYGFYWWNPAADLADSVNPNSGEWYRQHAWTDRNANRLWEPGEEGRLIRRRGGTATTALDPDLKDTRTDEVAAWVERELVTDFGVRTGFIFRRITNLYQNHNANRPFSAFTVPVTIQDPGEDGRVGTRDDGPAIQAFNLSAEALARPTLNLTANLPGESDFYTWEIAGTKRLSHGWSLLGGFSYQWVRDNENAYRGNAVRGGDAVENPNDRINTAGGRHEFTLWTVKLNGTWNAPWWGLVVSPTMRHQSGQPFGRTFLARLNYGSQRILAEPVGTRRQDHITVVDVRLEKVIRLGDARRLSGFFDLYNLLNSNAAENINWSSGSTFLRPSVIVAPRIARVGVKVDW